MRSVNEKLHSFTITGYFLPYLDNQPVIVEMDGHMFLPIFSTFELLEEMIATTEVDYDSIKQIGSQADFLDSLPPGLKIMVDPHRSPTGTVLFMLALP